MMSWDSIIGTVISIFVFFGLSVIWTLMAAPLLIFAAILLVPFFILVMIPISGALAITWAWMWDEHELLGTEWDAVPG